MNPMLLKILPTLIGLAGLIFLYTQSKKHKGNFFKSKLWLGGLVFCSIYFFYNAVAYSLDIYYQIHYNSFDLNNNGNMELSEWTDDAKIASDNLIKDTARTFAPIIGFIFASVIAIIVMLTTLIWNKIMRKDDGKTIDHTG